MKRIFLFLLLIGACLSYIQAQLSPTIIDVTDDVYVYSRYVENDPSVSSWQEDHLLSYYNDGADSRYMVFLKFDLSTLTDLNPEQINSIKLRLYGTADEGGGAGTPETHTLKVFNMTAANPNFQWTEERLSYNGWFGNGVNSTIDGEGNSGQSDAYFFRRNPDITTNNNNGNPTLCVSTLSNVGPGTQWYEWDLTSTIVAYAGQELSLQICDEKNLKPLSNPSGKSFVTFHSKENSSGNKPHIEITYRNTQALRTVKTVADTYITESGLHGADTELRSYYNQDRRFRQMVFMKFDLDLPYNPDLIEGAKLRLYGTAQEGGGSSTPFTHTLDLFDMTSYAINKKQVEDVDWDEATFDFQAWNSSAYVNDRNPDIGTDDYEPCRIYRLEGATGGEKWFEWNIAEWLQNNLDKTITLQVCDKDQIKTATGNSLAIFHSRENSSGFGPEIELQMKQSNLLLSEIRMNETPLTGFDSYITNYDCPISSTEDLPVVAATLKSEGATINYEQAAPSNNQAKIIVRSDDEELIYTITFNRDITEIEIPVEELENYEENSLLHFRKIRVTGDMEDNHLAMLRNALGNNEVIVNIELAGEISTGAETSCFAAINPNCLIYIPADEAPEGWTNVVQKDGTETNSLSALTPITLVDGYPFDCPIPVAGEASYTRNCYNDTNWETIILPFDVTGFDEFGNYIVEKFEAQQESTIRFKEIASINDWKANEAYLMRSKVATGRASYIFSNPDATIQTSPKANGLTGIYEEIRGTDKFILNETGTLFGKGSATATVPAFRAYYLPENPQNVPAQFAVEHDNITSIRTATTNYTVYSQNGVVYICTDQAENVSVYSIDGQLVRKVSLQNGENRIEHLNKGIYLVKNQKLVVH